MIFARDKSQMCNNLLQYAHVYAWGREHGRKVISMRFSYKYQYFKICHTNLTSFTWYLVAKYLAALQILPTASFKRRDCDREALERKMLKHRHIVVSGWFVRYYDLFLKYRNEIVDLFTLDEQYTAPVKSKMQEEEKLSTLNSQLSTLRLGVHIRRGDYAQWSDGKYFYADEVYAGYINKFVTLHPGKLIHVYLSTNDPYVTCEKFQEFCPQVCVHHLCGSAPEDLFMLSECDYLIGPPSTFSMVASMYRDIPLYRMDTGDALQMTLEGFRNFEYWFQNMV
ncbi:MAG: alpha-1,2-fucosyltransferase [Prevotella sp.]|nr:alpha-1,2-fucosyltransferase [Prevotella sp.]